ncbi:MAG: molybdate ABC transporter substrate-binding protein, partial [Myxococcota bacterium]|nr:molybdate ABC transporter substrate-binding protein [Myxococcota bacterium]
MAYGIRFGVGTFFWCLFCFSASASEIWVGSAVSLRAPMEEVSRQFELAHPGVRVRGTFGSSSNLARQIEFGAPIQVFVSADEYWVERLISASLVKPMDHFRLASNRLVVVIRRGADIQIRSPADL